MARGRGDRIKCARVPALVSSRLALSRIETILAGLKFFDHGFYVSSDLVLAAFRAAADRSAAVLFLALRRDWREMAIVEAALCP